MLRSGARLGPYEVSAPLGAGGMGEVYRARDTRLGRDVALKVLPESFAHDPGRMNRFAQEARAASALNHPNIVTIHDVGREEGVSYFAMELVEGTSLRDRLEGKPMPLVRLLGIAAPIADGLAAAHARGIVHRDLKPENVMIDRDGRVKILDFGLARRDPGFVSESDATVTAMASTTEGTILGTAAYMSPEQASGRPADFRSDQFSFGSILYEMATGRRPFPGSGALETMAAIVRDEPPPLESAAPGLPAPFVWVVQRCLEKEPGRRYGSTADLARDLENLRSLPAGGARAEAAPAAGSSAAAAILAGAGLLALAASGILATRRPSAPRPPAVRFALPPPPDATFDGMLAVSPGGDRIAFVASGADGRRHVWIRRLDSGNASLLAGADDAAFPFWSSDGRSLAFFSDERLKKIALDGGVAETLCPAHNPRGGTWGSRGDILFAVDGGSRIVRVPAAGGAPRSVTTLDAKRSDGTHRTPVFLPDGEHFLFYVLTQNPGSSGIYAGSIRDREQRFLLPSDSVGYFGAGTIYFRRGRALLGQRLDPSRVRLVGEPWLVAEDPWWNGWAPGWVGLSASSDAGVLAFQGGGMFQSRLVWFDRSGKELGTIGAPGAYGELALSPDEKRLALSRSPGTTDGSIHELDLALGTATKITSGPGFEDCPVYLPGGREIAFSTYPEGRIYRQSAAEGAPRTFVYQADGFPEIEEWSSSFGAFLFSRIDLATGGISLWKVDGAGHASRLDASAANEESPRASPDGRWLAYSSDESGRTEVYVRPRAGGGPRKMVSSGGGAQPAWNGTGTELFFVRDDARLLSVRFPGADLGAARPPAVLFSAPLVTRIEARNEYVPTRDGQRFIVNVRLPQADPVTVIVNGSAPPAR